MQKFYSGTDLYARSASLKQKECGAWNLRECSFAQGSMTTFLSSRTRPRPERPRKRTEGLLASHHRDICNPRGVAAGAHFVGADDLRAFQDQGRLGRYRTQQASGNRRIFAVARQSPSDE